MTFEALQPKSRAAGGSHSGLTQRIRDEIKQFQPITIPKLAEQLGVPAEPVKSLVNQLCDRLGGFAPVPWSSHNAKQYATVEWIRRQERRRKTQKSGGQEAGKIEIGRGFRWGSGLL